MTCEEVRTFREYCKVPGIVRLRLPMRVFSKRETSDNPY